MKKIKSDQLSGRYCSVHKYLRIVFLIVLVVTFNSPQSIAAGINDRLDADYFAVSINGRVLDEKGAAIAGASITEQGTNNATLSRADGSFSITVAGPSSVLVISHIGYAPQDVTVGSNQTLTIRLVPLSQAMDSVIVVGYGRQRKQSVVASITQTTGAVLQRAGGVSNIGAALTGNVPGVITIQGTGMPGIEDPQIFIRGMGTWNDAGPLILVDGIRRNMNGLDIGSVESISILKDFNNHKKRS